MDRDTFMRLFDESEMDEAMATGPGGPGSPKGKEKIFESLEEGASWFFDASGNGTDYRCSGARFGEGFVEARLTIEEDGTGIVFARSAPVPDEYEYSLAKLCRMWNRHFRVKGLYVRDGYLTFESEPIDLVNGSIEASRLVGMALTTVHAYTGAILALKAGVDPWELIEYDEWDGGGRGGGNDDEDDEDDGTSLDEIISHMSAGSSRMRETCA